MKHYVYVIYSSVGDCYYRGYSTQPNVRLEQHLAGESRFTSKYNDWELKHIEIFDTKREALQREKGLKKYSKSQLISLFNTPKNEIDKMG